MQVHLLFKQHGAGCENYNCVGLKLGLGDMSKNVYLYFLADLQYAVYISAVFDTTMYCKRDLTIRVSIQLALYR